MEIVIALDHKDSFGNNHLTSMLSRRAISISLGTNRIASMFEPRFPELLLAREEFSFKRMRGRTSFRPQDVALAYEALFFGRPRLETSPKLRVGPIDDKSPSLEITFTWLREITEELEGTVRFRTVKVSAGDDLEEALPGLDISFADRQTLVSLERLDRDVSLRSRLSREPEVPVVYLPSQGLSREEMGRLWDTIALTEDEDTIVSALRSISPSIEKIVLVQTPNARNTRTLMAKLEEFPDPVPFKSLGEGVDHLLSISLALIRARNGVILVDEVENGIHYSVQASMWEMIFKQSKRWNIQVFATTHSWDCVEGFQIAASALEGSASLFRLEILVRLPCKKYKCSASKRDDFPRLFAPTIRFTSDTPSTDRRRKARKLRIERLSRRVTDCMVYH